MKRCLFLIFVVVFEIFGENTFEFYHDNDLFITDEDYTSGVEFKYKQELDEGGNYNGFSFGQKFYTPSNITENEAKDYDRPYAAWLYLGIEKEKIEQQLAQQVKTYSQKLAGGDRHETVNALKLLTDVIDVGVTHLIREPKKCLKFNFVVDKTLNGVINMTTHLGYKRLEKLGTQLDQQVAVVYVDYFLKFMRHQA